MTATCQSLVINALLYALSLVLFSNANADLEGEEHPHEGLRTEIWLAATNWPALTDLNPVVGGSFNSVGYGLGGSVHWPIALQRGPDLSLGLEGAVMATESDIPVYLDELLARDGWVAASVRWRPGKARSVSLDAGLAYHLLDITQLQTNDNAFVEFESWEESALGPFFGITWDIGANREAQNRGLTLGLQVHFLDFGTVRDEDVLASVVLGRNAGNLDGPIIALRLGYRWR